MKEAQRLPARHEQSKEELTTGNGLHTFSSVFNVLKSNLKDHFESYLKQYKHASKSEALIETKESLEEDK